MVFYVHPKEKKNESVRYTALQVPGASAARVVDLLAPLAEPSTGGRGAGQQVHTAAAAAAAAEHK